MPKKSNKKKPNKRKIINKKSISTSKSNYTAKDIEVLEGLEPVRKRPGMYIGGTDTAALHHLVSEVLDNSMDEVVAGFADKVEIKLINSNTIEISSSDKIEECENSNYLVNSTNDKITNEIVYRLMFENKDQLDSFKKQIEGSKNIKKINVDLV